MVDENGRIPARVHEFWVFPKFDDEKDIRRWLLEERLFSQSELDRLNRASLADNHLHLLITNLEDPVAVSLIYGMNDKQLNRFRRYIPSDTGQLYLGILISRWMADNALIEKFAIEEFNEVERRREYIFTKRARAYWAIANRYNKDMFEEQDNISIREAEEREDGVLALAG